VNRPIALLGCAVPEFGVAEDDACAVEDDGCVVDPAARFKAPIDVGALLEASDGLVEVLAVDDDCGAAPFAWAFVPEAAPACERTFARDVGALVSVSSEVCAPDCGDWAGEFFVELVVASNSTTPAGGADESVLDCVVCELPVAAVETGVFWDPVEVFAAGGL
jgi:hypothetical protein